MVIKMDDLISRQAAINEIKESFECGDYLQATLRRLENLPSVQPERLTDDDFETIRIHLNAYKEKLCNQQRWGEAEEYQRILDRFMAFAHAQPKHGRWLFEEYPDGYYHATCSECDVWSDEDAYLDGWNYCPNCGTRMDEEE